jgi:hypothetical protein
MTDLERTTGDTLQMIMGRPLLVLLNHPLTPDQEADARKSLGVDGIVEPPARVRDLWAQVPPELPTLDEHLAPVRGWLREHARPGDPVLIHGDFGAAWLMVRFALETGLVPVYSTTRRSAVQEPQPDGSVRLIHRFRHVRFREYGQ